MAKTKLSDNTSAGKKKRIRYQRNALIGYAVAMGVAAAFTGGAAIPTMLVAGATGYISYKTGQLLGKGIGKMFKPLLRQNKGYMQRRIARQQAGLEKEIANRQRKIDKDLSRLNQFPMTPEQQALVRNMALNTQKNAPKRKRSLSV